MKRLLTRIVLILTSVLSFPIILAIGTISGFLISIFFGMTAVAGSFLGEFDFIITDLIDRWRRT